MSGLFWRILIATICVLAFWVVLPPFLRILGVPMNADLFTIVRVVVAIVAIFYVLKGPNPPLPGV